MYSSWVAKCYGRNLATGDLNIENWGIIAAQS